VQEARREIICPFVWVARARFAFRRYLILPSQIAMEELFAERDVLVWAVGGVFTASLAHSHGIIGCRVSLSQRLVAFLVRYVRCGEDVRLGCERGGRALSWCVHWMRVDILGCTGQTCYAL